MTASPSLRHSKQAGNSAALLASTLLSSSPVLAGPPFTTDDPEPAPEGKYEIYLFSTGTRTHEGFEGALPGFEINYGAGPDLQVSGAVEQAYESPKGEAADWHYGSAEFGVKYRFLEEDADGWRPQVAFYPSLERDKDSKSVSSFLPLWLQKSIGDWEVFGGGGRRFNPGRGNRDSWFLGGAALRHLTEQLEVGGELFHESADEKGEPSASGFNLAAIYEFNEQWSLVSSAGRGLNHTAQTNEFSYYIGLGLLLP